MIHPPSGTEQDVMRMQLLVPKTAALRVNVGKWRVPLSVGLEEDCFPPISTLLKADLWVDEEWAGVRRMLATPPLSTDVEGGGTSVRTISVTGTSARVKLFTGAAGLPQEVALLPLRSVIFTGWSADSGLIESMGKVPAASILNRLPVVLIGDPATVKMLDEKVTATLTDWVGTRRAILVIKAEADQIWTHRRMELILRLPPGMNMPKV